MGGVCLTGCQDAEDTEQIVDALLCSLHARPHIPPHAVCFLGGCRRLTGDDPLAVFSILLPSDVCCGLCWTSHTNTPVILTLRSNWECGAFTLHSGWIYERMNVRHKRMRKVNASADLFLIWNLTLESSTVAINKEMRRCNTTE